jgi:hypothetical protein
VSFSTTFVFAIIPQYYGMSSHGLAFVLSSTKELFSALPGQYLGLLNKWNYGNFSNHLLAIELDTIFNAEFKDINDNHIGIDINALNSVQSAVAGYYTSDGYFSNLSLISTKPMQVWVDYDSKHTMLNVTISPYCLGTVVISNNSFWSMTTCLMEALIATCTLKITVPPTYAGLKGSTSSKV